MDLKITQDKLLELIRANHLSLIEHRQIVHRLRGLQDSHLKQTKRKIRAKGGSAEVERQALTHPEYLDFLEKIAETSHQQIKSRVDYETYLMLFKARQSTGKQARRR